MGDQNAGGKPPVKSQEDLRAHFGQLSPLAEKKVLYHLDRFCRDFIALSPFLVIASSDGKGHADASPRGDAPGFVSVLDDKTLLIPDRRGNNRVDTLRNLVRDPRIALLFMIPGIGQTLRVNGRAEIVIDPELNVSFAFNGKLPKCVLVVTADRVYTQCPKALVRSRLWSADAQVARSELPSPGEMIAALSKGAIDGAEYDAAYPQRLKETIY
jgi:PPOX class probable FMN-dependent enzyme